MTLRERQTQRANTFKTTSNLNMITYNLYDYLNYTLYLTLVVTFNSVYKIQVSLMISKSFILIIKEQVK